MPKILEAVKQALPKFCESVAARKSTICAMDIFVGSVLDRLWYSRKTNEFWISVKMPKPSPENIDAGYGTVYCDETVDVRIPLPGFLISQQLISAPLNDQGSNSYGLNS